MLDVRYITKTITEALGHPFYSVWTPAIDKSRGFDYPAIYWLDPRKAVLRAANNKLYNQWTIHFAAYDQHDSDRTVEQRDQAHANALLLAEKVIYHLSTKRDYNGYAVDLKLERATHVNEWDDPEDGTTGVIYEVVLTEADPICHTYPS